MKKKTLTHFAFFSLRGLIALAFCLTGLSLALLTFALSSASETPAQTSNQTDTSAVIGTCDTAGPVEVEATAANLGPTAYPNLAAAIAAINAGTHQGAITVEICASTTETGAMFLNSSGAGPASYTSINIYPLADGLTISGPTSPATRLSNSMAPIISLSMAITPTPSEPIAI